MPLSRMRRSLATLSALLAAPLFAASPTAAVASAAGQVAFHRSDPGLGGPPGQTGLASEFPPILVKTDQHPTGYAVTFRYWDPGATSVQIDGEWYFATSAISGVTSTFPAVVSTPGLLPSRWRRGDFPIAYPNSTDANWPVISMKEVGHSGLWTYTTPLPSGVFSYGFYVNCSSPTPLTSCTEVSDPSNPPWNTVNGVTTGSVESNSQVYVPSDPRFGTIDYWWQAPNPKRGRVADLTYPSPGHATPADENYIAVYTPPGYNPHRPTPYPTLYLNPGGGEGESDWNTTGDLGNIMDNLIDSGQIQPMIVVTPNSVGYGPSPDPSNSHLAYNQDTISNLIPWVRSHYNVSPSASERALAGLSGGAENVNSMLLYNPGEFGYYGVLSPGTWNYPLQDYSVPTITPAQLAAMKQITGIFVGGGWQDPIHSWATGEISQLVNGGVPVTTRFIDGGHEWSVWRTLLKDFLTRVAF